MNNLMVSIITPMYNASMFIEFTAKSIFEQTYSNWEWLIIDDNSSDNSFELIKEFAFYDDRIKIHKNTGNKGPGNCRNIGIINAKGRFITFIDSDDCWFPNFLEKNISKVNEESCSFVYSSYERWDENLEVKFNSFVVPKKMTYNDLLYTCPISCLTAFIDIKKLGKKFMSDLPKRQDYGLWLDYLKETNYAIGIIEPLAKYRIRKGSLSSNKATLIKYQFLVYYKQQNLNFIYSVFYTFSWAYNGYIKYKGISRN